MRWHLLSTIAAMRLAQSLVLCISASMASHAYALSAQKALPQFAIDTWRTSDGLPELAVQTVLESSDGYLWVGTQDGLARFDGKIFTVFKRANVPQMTSENIVTLMEDSDHSLWIGTNDGILRRDADGQFKPFGKREGVPISQVLATVRGPKGDVWIGGIGGLVHSVNGTLQTVDSREGLESDVVTGLVVDSHNTLWVLARGVIYKYENGRFEDVSSASGLKGKLATWLTKNHEGDVWALTNGYPIYRLVNDKFEAWWPTGVPNSARIHDVYEDREGNVWVTTVANGLYRSGSRIIQGEAAEQGFSDMSLISLYEDSHENLWIGTFGRGLIRLRDGPFTSYTKKDGLAADSTSSVLEDNAGNVWVGTLDGLTRLSLEDVKQFTHADGLSNNYISSLLNDSEGGLWVGMGETTLNHLRDNKVDAVIHLQPPLVSFIVTAMLLDNRKRLWIGTNGSGLAKYDHGTTTFYTNNGFLPDNFVNTLIEDPHGRLWVGTNHGIVRITGDDFDIDPLGNYEVQQASITSLYVDDSSVLWIGTDGRGLFRVWGHDVMHIGSDDGLPNDTINSILTDAAGDLWLGSNRGVAKLNRDDVDQFSRGQIPRLTATLFGEADGMASSETFSGSPAAWRSKDGRLWFITTQGVAVVDPKNIQLDTRPLSVSIESVRSGNVFFGRDNKLIEVPANTSLLEVGYSAPNLSSGSTTQFRFRLDGAADVWTEVGNERTARYVNVPAGQHVFEVQARRANEDWIGPVTSVSFAVIPPFYQSNFFYIFIVIFGLSGLWLTHYLRMEWIRMQSAVSDERRRIAGEIHDNLAQGFTAVSFQIEAALSRLSRSPERAINHLNLAREAALSSLSEARRSVWNLQPFTKDATALANSIKSGCEQIVLGRIVSLIVSVAGTPWTANPLIELNMTRVGQQAVSNATQHGEAKEISITLAYSTFSLTMVVSDDGRGFNVDEPITSADRGFGLRNMRQRAHKLNGRIQIVSSPGVGTQITVTVPRFSFLRPLQRILTSMKDKYDNAT